MAIRYCIVPQVGSGTRLDPYRPKYFDDVILAPWAGLRYGREGARVVESDLDAAQVVILSAQLDTVLIPADLDQVIGADLTRVSTRCEALQVPVDWATSSMSWRELLRRIWAMCLVLQRARIDVFRSGRTLETRLRDIPNGGNILTALESIGYSAQRVNINQTCRAVLDDLGDQQRLGPVKISTIEI